MGGSPSACGDAGLGATGGGCSAFGMAVHTRLGLSLTLIKKFASFSFSSYLPFSVYFSKQVLSLSFPQKSDS